MVKPSKKLDEGYSGEYDFLLDGIIKIEVKASRAVDFDTTEAPIRKGAWLRIHPRTLT